MLFKGKKEIKISLKGKNEMGRCKKKCVVVEGVTPKNKLILALLDHWLALLDHWSEYVQKLTKPIKTY